MKPHYYNIVSFCSFLGAHRAHKPRLTCDCYQQCSSCQGWACPSPGHACRGDGTPGAKGAGWAETQVVTAGAAQLTRVTAWKQHSPAHFLGTHQIEHSLPCSMLGKPQLQPCVQVWVPCCQEDRKRASKGGLPRWAGVWGAQGTAEGIAFGPCWYINTTQCRGFQAEQLSSALSLSTSAAVTCMGWQHCVHQHI